ncbi:hypothetical protein YQE_12611, partial [Dendroctonus ponderosae]
MASTSLTAIIVIISSLVLIDVFCAEVSQSRQNAQSSAQISSDAVSSAKSTTPWPALGQRAATTPRPNSNKRTSRPATQSPKKWIQQNNIWIRNEQASAGGEVGTSQTKDPKSNVQNVRAGVAQQPATTSGRPPLNRGDTYTVLKPQVLPNHNQQALINGLNGNKQSVGPPTSPTSKPLSYAGAVGPKQPQPHPPPSSTTSKAPTPTVPSTGPVSELEEESKRPQNTNDGSGASDDELREFAENILRKDTNNAMKYVTLNIQGMTSSRSSSDEAPKALLNIADPAFKILSIEKIILLYNNYFLDAGQNEVYTGQERIEENNFLDAILATPVMQFARNFLVQKEKIGKDPKEFKDLLRQIWFNMYSRGNGRIGSSGFEHVFVAEIKNNQVSGLHNWLYFNEEESQGRANYLGYLKKLDLGEKGAIVKYHFTFHDIDKPVGSMFVGTSPELEMALYTTCFVLRADRICPLKMNGNKFIIRTYTYRYRGKNMIGSAFPEI